MMFSDRWTRVVMSSVLAVGVSGMASATWTDFYVVKTQTSNSGVNLDVYQLFARFNGPTDTVLNAFNLDRTTSSGILNGFYHKDNFTGNSGVLQTATGSWAPSLTGSAAANRPFDSYLTVGGLPTAANGTSADPSWGNPLSWGRPDIPSGQQCGWFAPGGSIVGRVGQAGNTANSVFLGQFVVDCGVNAGTFNISIGYNSGVPGTPVQFADGTFTLGGGGFPTLYRDLDGDGFGALASGSIVSCAPVTGYVSNNTDCDDTRFLYADNDGDTYGAGPAVACGVQLNTDCNNTNAAIYPGAPELCATSTVDNNCNGVTTDVDTNAVDKVNFFRDQDLDSYSTNVTATFCPGTTNAGYVAALSNPIDCNDTNPVINPATVWYSDSDGDGLGVASAGTLTQCASPLGYSLVNGDNCPTIANPNQADCNSNSIGDVCELASGALLDCDGDLVPDVCEGAVFVAAQSNLLALTGAVFAEQTFTGLLRAYGAQPKITIEATADLGAANDGVIVSVEGGTGTVYFLTDGIDCPTTPNTAVLSYGLPAFNAMVADGALTVRVTAFGAVNSATCANGGVRIKLNYTGLPPSADCNNNGVLDSCEIATGAQPDCNSNGVPDSCDIASGYSADCNSNGKPDTCDIASGASSDINANGRPDDCSGELVVGGSGFATVQAAIFAAPIGATIVVGPGVRHEYIGIDRRITLRSAAGAATTILDGAGLSQSIVSFLGTDSNGAVLDGFTIRNGPSGSNFGVLGGGGVTLVQSNGTVRNCVFLNNHSDVGGAVYGILSAATIEGCTFTGNSAAVSGGAIQFELGSGWIVRDCDFTNNISAGVGGVAHAISTTGVIADCAMTGNHATGAGGAISWDSTDGGAIRVAGCSIEANFAASGGGIAVVAGIGAVDLFQSRLCRNMPDNLQGAINDLGGNIIGTDCNGNGVCDADEIAAGTAFDCNANGVLDSCDLASTTSLDCNENDIPDSCDIASGLSHDIDSNGIPDECKPDCDHDGVPDSWELSQGIEVDCNLNGRPDSCDIAASTGLDKNGNGHLDSCELARGDLNLDSAVNAADLSIMLNFWGWLNPPVGDLDGDNTVSGADLATLLNNWGTAP